MLQGLNGSEFQYFRVMILNDLPPTEESLDVLTLRSSENICEAEVTSGDSGERSLKYLVMEMTCSQLNLENN